MQVETRTDYPSRPLRSPLSVARMSVEILALLAVLVVAGLILAGLLLRPSGPRYRPRALLTPPEKQFFATLRKAVPELHVFPQVSMGAIMEPVGDPRSADRREARRAMSAWGSIRANRIDFCLADAELNVICLVELDDRSHHSAQAREKDADRDARTAEAGYPTVRFGWVNGRLPGPKAVRERLLETLGAPD